LKTLECPASITVYKAHHKCTLLLLLFKQKYCFAYIHVTQIPSGVLKGELAGHNSIIYDLCWSKSDRGLLSASADATARYEYMFVWL